MDQQHIGIYIEDSKMQDILAAGMRAAKEFKPFLATVNCDSLQYFAIARRDSDPNYVFFACGFEHNIDQIKLLPKSLKVMGLDIPLVRWDLSLQIGEEDDEYDNPTDEQVEEINKVLSNSELMDYLSCKNISAIGSAISGGRFVIQLTVIFVGLIISLDKPFPKTFAGLPVLQRHGVFKLH